MKKALALLAALATSSFAQLYHPAWSHYRTVTVNTAGITGADLTNFPLLVRFTTDNANDLVTGIQAGGADIRVSSPDGSTALDFEIESATVGTEVTLWVKVPLVIGGNASAASFRVYWGNGSASTASNPNAVFGSAGAGYEAAFHFKETGGANTSFTDAAQGLTTATTGTANATSTPVIGVNARAFGAATAGVSDVTAAANYATFTTPTLQSYSGPITLSAWVRSSITSNGNAAQGHKHIIYNGTGTTGQNSHVYLRRTGKVNGVQDNAVATDYATNNRYTAGGDTSNVNGGPYVTFQEADITLLDRWYFIAATWNGTSWSIYRQRQSQDWNTPVFAGPTGAGFGVGSILQTDSAKFFTGIPGNGAVNSHATNPWFIGAFSENGAAGGNIRRGWQGHLDEVRIAKSARSADYLRLSFETQKDIATARTIGASTPTSLASSGVSFRTDFTAKVSASGVSFTLGEGSVGTLSVVDVHGRTVWTRDVTAGTRDVVWSNASGKGVYVARFASKNAGIRYADRTFSLVR